MKGYTIQHSIDLLEDSVEDLEARPSGGGTAADVSYDNTSSHLTADDVQEAIDELNTVIGQIDTGDNYSETETIIGKWIDNKDLYRKVITFENSLVIPLDSTWVSTGVTMTGIDTITRLSVLGGTHGFMWNIVSGFFNSDVLTLTSVVNAGSSTAGVKHIILEYTKDTPVTNTRSKKK